MDQTIQLQINLLQERIDNLKTQKAVTSLDDFLIEVWKRSIKILKN